MRGLPHLAFRKNYLTCLRVFVSQATALAQCDMTSPGPPGWVSVCHAHSSEQESESPRKTRRARRRLRPTRVRDEPVGVEYPTMTVQDIPDLTGAIIYDCRPPLLPVSLRLKDIWLLPRTRPVASASLAAPPPEDSMVIGVAIPEVGVAPPDVSGTDLQDELLTPEDSMVIGGTSPEGVVIPELGVASPDDSGTDLEDELLSISPLPPIVSRLTEPDETLPVSGATGSCSTGPCSQCRVAGCSGRTSNAWLVPVVFISPAQSFYDPATSPITPDLQDDSGFLPPDSPATMDQYIAADGDLFWGDSSDLPLLSLLLLPIPVADVSGPVSAVTPSVGEPVLLPSVVLPDLSQEGPFDVDQDASGSEVTPRMLESLPGCQYRMTSYDAADRSDLDLA